MSESSHNSSDLFKAYGACIHGVADECPRREPGIAHVHPHGAWVHLCGCDGRTWCLRVDDVCKEAQERWPFFTQAQSQLIDAHEAVRNSMV